MSLASCRKSTYMSKCLLSVSEQMYCKKEGSRRQSMMIVYLSSLPGQEEEEEEVEDEELEEQKDKGRTVEPFIKNDP